MPKYRQIQLLCIVLTLSVALIPLCTYANEECCPPGEVFSCEDDGCDVGRVSTQPAMEMFLDAPCLAGELLGSSTG